MNNTGLKDRNGKDIFLGNEVILEGNKYDVIVNDFDQNIVVDSDLGQVYLVNVHMNCEVISK